MVELTADVLYHLSAYLDDSDLRNFSLVDRLFNDVSRRYLYKTIVVKFSSPDLLDVAVAIWTRILERANSFKYVRHVKVVAKHLEDYRRAYEFDYNDCGDDYGKPWQYCLVDKFNDRTLPKLSIGGVQVLLTRDSQWDDLSRFMKGFPNLKELTWGCEELIPASVFRCVSQDHPGLRLHLRSFKLRSLERVPGTPALTALSPYELELVTSPCLYSLAMWGRTGYMYEVQHAIMDMLAGAAPNLREVDFSLIGTFWHWPVGGYQRGSQLPVLSSDMGALRHIGIHSNHQYITLLARYSSVTDFSQLESLEMHDSVGIEMFELLARCHLPTLQHLSFNLINRGVDEFDEDHEHLINEAVSEMNEAVTNLIPSLTALQSIRMGGPFEEHTLRVVLDYCGHRLRRLLLSTYDVHILPTALVGIDLVREIQQKCPNLEELALTVLRSKGDASEVAIYRALGTLASIRKIHLKMCYSQSFLRNSEHTSRPDMMYAKAQILDQVQETELDDALINIAVDQSLAESIFRTISTSKPAYSPPLERVSLGVSVMKDFSSSIWSSNLHLYNVLRCIGRSWTCVRNPREDKLHDCFATGYDPKERISRERLTKQDISLDMSDSAVAQAVCRVWPAAKTNDWKQVWHSFELDTSE